MPSDTPTLTCTPIPDDVPLDFTIHFHILDGAGNVAPQRFIDLTNNFYQRNNVDVAVKQGSRVDYTEQDTINILGDDKWFSPYNEKTEFDPNAPEVVALYSNNLSNGVNAYFVEAIITGDSGTSEPSRNGFVYATNPQAVFEGYRAESPRTFYHELGHVIHGEGHIVGDPNNYMTRGGEATGVDTMTPEQVEQVRKFAFTNP